LKAASQTNLTGAVLVFGFLALKATAVEVSNEQWESLNKEVATLRKNDEELRKLVSDLSGRLTPVTNSVEKTLNSKYGPGAAVVTKQGKLNISGLLQIWYYSPQKDHNALFQDPVRNGIADTNEAVNNDTFRIRRSELRFSADVTEHVFGEVMLDAAREAQSFPSVPDNQANSLIFKRLTNTNLANVQGGVGSAPRLLQEAYVVYHDFIPHHEFKIGQYKPPIGEEGPRSSSQLDFVERSFVGQLADNRDLGIAAHGSWWCDDGKGNGQFQYWVGAYDSAGNFHQSGGQQQNRADDNNSKDFLYRILIRPVWKERLWGSLELGYSQQFGRHGGSAGPDPIDAPVNGINTRKTWADRMDAWGYYAPDGPVRGWWVRGEWEWQHDRNAPQQVIDLLGQGNAGDGNTQTNGKPFSTQGFYVSTGYRLGNSRFCEDISDWARNLEFLFRYETYGNVEVANVVHPDHTNVYKTSVFTGGINYYISGNTKIQLNYNVLHNPHPDDPNFVFHNVRDNNLVVNFQVAW
jgi:hypothetical protein